MSTLQRRTDIDWLRVIAIGLLLIYHVAIGFQPWGIMIGFITNKESWMSLWLPMSMLNVWRIPLLFFVSGMGLYFSMRRRNWKELIGERALRILVPYVFGMIAIFPLSVLMLQYYNDWDLNYSVNPGHLWFLGNIFVYVLILSPLFYWLKRSERAQKFVRAFFSTPLSLLFVTGCFIAEAMIMRPNPYEMYAMTWHGFVLGLIAFLFGFCFVMAGDDFWKMLVRWRWLFFIGAVGLFFVRMVVFQMRAPNYLLVTESQCWILSVFAFGHHYLTNTRTSALSYPSEAAYPVYITHMIFLSLGSMLIFPWELAVEIKFVMLLVFTFCGCFVLYEFVIKRVNVLRVLFGLKTTAIRQDLNLTRTVG